jgi:hypothetical protein
VGTNNSNDDFQEAEVGELLAYFMKIPRKEIKNLVINFAKTCARWEDKKGGP